MEADDVLAIDYKPILKILKEPGCPGIENPDLDLCEYVIEYLKGISPRIIENKNMSNKIRYSIYLNELIKFYLLPKNIKENGEKLSTRYKIEKAHAEIMLDKYTKKIVEKSGGVLYLKDKIPTLRNLYHILTLALLLNGYEFNFETLARVLKIDIKAMTNYFKEIGCTIKSDLKKSKSGLKNTIAKLNAPLKFNYRVKNFVKKK